MLSDLQALLKIQLANSLLEMPKKANKIEPSLLLLW
jgi:hypothetical protein